MYKRITLFAALATMFLLSATAFGQGTTGNISGTVTDPNGAVVPGATVKVTNTSTNQSRESSAGGDGAFAFQALPPGRYKVDVTAANFAAYTVEADVNITQTTSIDAKLSVSGVGGDVTVDYEATVIQPESSQQGRV
ncbi:MAG: carboxypeptidase-like regulatory domain-containing protein, partial [Pyrinomonadaceae bacterium]